ncbi:MAG: class I SAM-dependent methyltransferase, partial [Ktedonobacteraceae bacterium]|nr:class I SAM-dependent methyltransferase [Ktedonobacteraceae bacterium]
MPEVSDRKYLLQEQYKNASNLNARVELHRRFSTSKAHWQHWVFEQFATAANSRILELGCGPAHLWRDNIERIPAGWDITLSDFSAGMLAEAQRNLEGSAHTFRFRVIDAQTIPFESESLDVVIANHMLYHVPDRARALGEIQRVLKKGGRLYAATNGQNHLWEISDLIRRVSPEYDYDLE